MAPSQSWREAQNKMNIVLVCSHSVEVNFDITSMYEDMNRGRRTCENREEGERALEILFSRMKTEMENKWRHMPVNLCVCVCVRFLL